MAWRERIGKVVTKVTPHLPPPLEGGDLFNQAVDDHMAVWLAQNGGATRGDRRYRQEMALYVANINQGGERALAQHPNSTAGKVSRAMDNVSNSWLGKWLHGE